MRLEGSSPRAFEPLEDVKLASLLRLYLLVCALLGVALPARPLEVALQPENGRRFLLLQRPPHQGALLIRDSHLDERKCYGAEQTSRNGRSAKTGSDARLQVDFRGLDIKAIQYIACRHNASRYQLRLRSCVLDIGRIHHEQSIHSLQASFSRYLD